MTERRKPPHSVHVLQRWVGELARQEGIAPARVQRWISFMVVAALLDHVRDENEDPVFLLKGGAAMELRLGLRARATKDFDTAYRQAIAETDAQRLSIKLSYRGRSWATVQLEVSAAEGAAGREIDRVAGKPLDSLGLVVPAEVPCVSVRYQIAQKLHACTEVPAEGRTNDRFRDLIDLLLLEELVGDEEWVMVREACEELFGLRAKQVWPPTVAVFDGWPEPYRALAAELSFPLDDVYEAAGRVDALVRRIAAPERSGNRL